MMASWRRERPFPQCTCAASRSYGALQAPAAPAASAKVPALLAAALLVRAGCTRADSQHQAPQAELNVGVVKPKARSSHASGCAPAQLFAKERGEVWRSVQGRRKMQQPAGNLPASKGVAGHAWVVYSAACSAARRALRRPRLLLHRWLSSPGRRSKACVHQQVCGTCGARLLAA